MAIFDYKCKECGFTDEYFKSVSVPKDMQPPEKCPKCGVEMERLSSFNCSFDIIGSCYENDYGKKAWQKNLTISQQADVLNGERDPY